VEIHLRITARYAGGKGEGQGVKLRPPPHVCPYLEWFDLICTQIRRALLLPFQICGCHIWAIRCPACLLQGMLPNRHETWAV